MAFDDDIFGAEEVANHLYDYATESAPGSVDSDAMRGRMARKLSTDPYVDYEKRRGQGKSTDPWRDYEDRRKDLETNYNYVPGTTPLGPKRPPLDFSAESTPVDPNEKRPDFSAEGTPVEAPKEAEKPAEQPPPLGVGGQVAAGGKAFAQTAATGLVADPLKAAALAPEMKKEAYDQGGPKATLGSESDLRKAVRTSIDKNGGKFSNDDLNPIVTNPANQFKTADGGMAFGEASTGTPLKDVIAQEEGRYAKGEKGPAGASGYAGQPQTPEEAQAAGAAFGVAGPYRKEIKAREREQAAAQEQLSKELAVPIEQRPLFQAGKAAQEKIEKAIPLTDQEKNSIGGKIGSFIGGVAPALALTAGGALVGQPELGMMLGATQMGMQQAGAAFEKALNDGATPEEAARAAGLNGIVGGALGVIPLHALFDPIRAAGTPILDLAGNEIGRKITPGLMGWLAVKLEQFAKSGGTFVGIGEAQEWLSKQIASEYNASTREKLRTDQAKIQTEIDKIEADPKIAAANEELLKRAKAEVKKYDEKIKDPSKYEVDWERVAISFFGGGVLGTLHPHGMARDMPPPDQWPPMPGTPPGTPPAAGGAAPGAGAGPGGPGAGPTGGAAGGGGTAGAGGAGPGSSSPGAGTAPGGGYTAPPRPPPTDTARQARMRPAFEKGLSDAGVNEPNLPFDELRDLYQTVDGLRTGFGRTDLAGKSPADLKTLFEQLSLLNGHGFTADELRTMSPADVAREYAQAVREGATAGEPPPAAEPGGEASPEHLSFDEFKKAVHQGMVNPAQARPGFSRIDRDLVEPRQGLLKELDYGMNLGYSTEDIAHYLAYQWAIDNDPNFKIRTPSGEFKHSPFTDQHIDGVYRQLQKEIKEQGKAKAASQSTRERFARIIADHDANERSRQAEPGQPEASMQEQPAGATAGPIPGETQPAATGAAKAEEATPSKGTRDDPIHLVTGADVERAAGLARQDHSHEQGEARNVQFGHAKWGPLPLVLEAPAGGVRKGINKRTGKPYEGRVGAATGFIPGVKGADGDDLDVYVGPNPENPTVYVLDEINKTGGKFRQTKSFIGFDSPMAAVDAYLKTDNKTAEQIGGITPMHQPQFIDWVHNGDHTRPVRATPPEPGGSAAAGDTGFGALPSPAGAGEGRPETPSPQAGEGREPIEVEPHHVQAVEDAITAAGASPHEVSGVDLHLAAEYHAMGVRDAREAFQLAFWVNGIRNGYFTPEDLADIYGEDVAQISERLSAEAGEHAPEHGAAATSEGQPAGPGVSAGGAEGTETKPAGAGKEAGVGEGAGADVGATASTEPAGGAETTGAEPVAERPGAATGAERPGQPHGGHGATTGGPSGRTGERAGEPGATETHPTAAEPGHAETTGAATSGGAEGHGAEERPTAGGETPETAATALKPDLVSSRKTTKNEQAFGNYRAFANTNDGGFLAVHAYGDTKAIAEQKAIEELQRRHTEREKKRADDRRYREEAGGRWKEIGKNADGKTLYEDARGVRSYVENGVRVTEPVQLKPARSGVEFDTDREAHPEFKTAEEAGGKATAPEEPEKIISPAVRVGGKIYTGITHGDAYDDALAAHNGIDPGSSKADRDLFLTNRGRVISAKEAHELFPKERDQEPHYEEKPHGATAPQDQAKPAAKEEMAPAIDLAHALADRLKEGKPITNRVLQQEAEKAFGSKLSEGQFDRKAMYDALETAVNLHIVADVGLHLGIHPDWWNSVDGRLEKLLDSLPTQTVRSEEQITHQQFSTPPTYAMAVAYAAGLRSGDVALEPSAGTGSIVAAATHPGVTVHANELSPRRAQLLKQVMEAQFNKGRVFTENAEQLNNVLPDDIKPTVVVMNPPFSQTAGRMGDKKDIMVGANHIEQALARLQPGGRLVAIVGRGMTPGAARFKDWWQRIGKKYDVRANIGVAGDLYKKYGTTFDTRLLVIDKVAPRAEAPIVQDVKSFPELMKALEGVRNARPAAEQRPTEPGRPEVAESGEGAAAAAPSERPAAGPLGPGEGGAAGVPGQGPAGGRGAGGATPGLETGERPGVAGEQPQRPEAGGAGARPDSGTLRGGQPGERGGGGAEHDLQSPAGGKPGAAAGGERDLKKFTDDLLRAVRVLKPGMPGRAGDLVSIGAAWREYGKTYEHRPTLEEFSNLVDQAAKAGHLQLGKVGSGVTYAGEGIGEFNAISVVKKPEKSETVASPAEQPYTLDTLKERAAHWTKRVQDTRHFETVVVDQKTRHPFEDQRPIFRELAEAQRDFKDAMAHVGRNEGVDDKTKPGQGRPWSGVVMAMPDEIKQIIDRYESFLGRGRFKPLFDKAREALAAETQKAAGAAGPPPGEKAGIEHVAPGEQHKGEITESLYEQYRPQRVRVKGAKPHPGPLVESASMASVPPPAGKYQPRLPKGVIEKGLLSEAQLEPVVYAGQAHSEMLPAAEGETGRRKGYFIGDGTGVGKGREVAGIILDNWQQGRHKAVWVSEKKTLMQDAKRDWSGLEQDPNLIFDFGKVKAGEPIKAEKGIGFVTYDTLKGGMSDQAALARGGFAKGQKVRIHDPLTGGSAVGTIAATKPVRFDKGTPFYKVKYEKDGTFGQHSAPQMTLEGEAKAAPKTRVDQLVDWLGKDFDGVIAFDEAHNMGNAANMAGARGMKMAAQKALAGIQLQNRLPNARIVYVSATGATEVSNLAYADRLGLWGRGTPFADRNQFINEVSSGGIAAMELVARDMKQMGVYGARNLSFDGVEYERLEHKLSKDQHEIYNTLATAWQHVLRNIEAALELTKGDKDSRAKSAAKSAFWGGHQRFFNQVVTALQMPSVIKAVEKDIAEGRQAVLQLTNTNEASQERAAAKAETAEDIEDLDITPRDQIIQLIEKSFPTQQYEKYVDEEGNESVRPVMDADGNPVQNKEAVEMRDRLIDELASIRVPQGPLDMILDHFGHENVAEATGRGRRFILKEDEKTGQRKRVEESRPASANIAETTAFQGGKKKILVFSEAGGTGRSYHADNAAPSKDARRAHYLVQGGWRADKAVQGFGRTHRTNQASAPIFKLVTTDLDGQKRFISSIARRLGQLGALTKGQRQAGDQGIFSARDNLESTEARYALQQFFTDLYNGRIEDLNLDDFEQQTGLKITQRDEDGAIQGMRADLPPITQFLNRLLSFNTDKMNATFKAFSDRLDAVIEARRDAGLLDQGLETIRAAKIKKDSEQTVYTESSSGAETKHVKLTVSDKFYPTKFNDIAYNPNRPITQWVKSPKGKVYAVSQAANVTNEAGAVLNNWRLTGTMGSRVEPGDKFSPHMLPKDWSKLPSPMEAQKLWDAENKAAPEFIDRDMHLITGAILPIWDRLKGSARVVRLQTDDGERMIGRVILNSQIAATLKALGAGATAGTKATPQQAFDAVMAGGSVSLANGWTINRRVVAGEHRIELKGPSSFSEGNEVKADGVFTERIGYQTRYFIPTDAVEGPKVMERITKYRPIASVEGGGGTIEENNLASMTPIKGTGVRMGTPDTELLDRAGNKISYDEDDYDEQFLIDALRSWNGDIQKTLEGFRESYANYPRPERLQQIVTLEKWKRLGAHLGLPRRSAGNDDLGRAEPKPVTAAREIMTPRAMQNIDQIKAAITKHIQDMVGTKVDINIVDTGDLNRDVPGWGSAAFNENRVTSGIYGQRSETRNDLKIPLRGVITLALHTPKTLEDTANHEAVHALIDLAATDPEVEVLKRERPRNRKIVQDYMDLTDQEVNNIAGFEIDAIAGEIYMGARDHGEPGSKFGFHVALRALFDRLWNLLRRIGNALRGLGFHTSEDIYRRMHEGEMADRPMRETQGIDIKADLDAMGDTAPAPRIETNELASISMSRRSRRRKRVRTLGELTSEKGTAGVRYWADRMIDVLHIEQEIEAAMGAPLPEHMRPYLADTLYTGRTGERILDVEAKHITPIIDDLKANGISRKDFSDYLYAAHAPVRNRLMARMNPGAPDGLSGMKTADARGIFAGHDTGPKGPVFRRNAQRVYQMLNEALWTRVNYGLMTPQQAMAWQNDFGPTYVPLRGFEEMEPIPGEGGGGGHARAYSVSGRESREALGRRSEAGDILSQSVLQAAQAINRGEKNRVANTVEDLARHYPNPDMWTVSNTETIRVKDPHTGMVTTKTVPVDPRADNVIVSKKNGRQQAIIIHRPLVARALKGIGVDDAADFVKWMRPLTRGFSRLRTTYNPEFILKNYQRDQFDASAAVLASYGPKGVAWYGKNMPHALQGSFDVVLRGVHSTRWSALYDRFRLAGGKITWVKHQEIEGIIRDIEARMKEGNVKKALLSVPRAIEHANEMLENATRMNLFATAVHHGASDTEAASFAREGTINFDRKGAGSMAQFMAALFPFFGANTQATYRFVRLLRGAPIAATFATAGKHAIRLAMAGMMMGGVVMTLYNHYMGGNNEARGTSYWHDVPEYEKLNNIIFMTGASDSRGKPVYVKVPMFSEGMLPWRAGELAAEVMTRARSIGYAAGQLWDAVYNMVPGLGSSHMGLPAIPAIPLSIKMNENAFGSRIHPDPSYFSHEVHEPKSQVKFPTTGAGWQTAAEFLGNLGGGDQYRRPVSLLDLHPEDVRYIATEVWGGFGSFIAGGAGLLQRFISGVAPTDIDVRDYPVLRQYWGHNYDVQISRDFTQARQEALDAAEAQRRGDKRPETHIDATGAGRFTGATKTMSGLNKQEAFVRADKTLGLAEIEKKISDLERRKSTIRAEALRDTEKATEAARAVPSAPPQTPSSAKPGTQPSSQGKPPPILEQLRQINRQKENAL